MIIQDLAAAVDNILDTVSLGYNIYQDQRNYDFSQKQFEYNQALQQKIFEREDNAVQRRRADLEAAGLNPNLAAGSVAGAGAPIAASGSAGGASVKNNIDILNNVLAAQQAKQNDLIYRLYESELSQSLDNKSMVEREQTMSQIESIFNSGTPARHFFIGPYGKSVINNTDGQYEVYEHNGKHFLVGTDENGNSMVFTRLDESRIWQEFKNGYTRSNNATLNSNIESSMLQYDAENQSIDRWIDRISKGIDSVTHLGGFIGNIVKGALDSKSRRMDAETNRFKAGRSGDYTESYTRNKSGYVKTRSYR